MCQCVRCVRFVSCVIVSVVVSRQNEVENGAKNRQVSASKRDVAKCDLAVLCQLRYSQSTKKCAKPLLLSHNNQSHWNALE